MENLNLVDFQGPQFMGFSLHIPRSKTLYYRNTLCDFEVGKRIKGDKVVLLEI